jgi:integrase/recombinase XerD
MLPDFLEWMNARNYAERTVRNHRFCLGYFFDWCEERGVFEAREVTKTVLDRYQHYLFHYRSEKTGKPLSFRSQSVRLSPVRGFFKCHARYNHILYNPASELVLPKMEKRLPRNILTAKEAELVLNRPDASTVLGVRDRAILEVLYSTGIRRGELVKLEIYDLEAEKGTLMIRQGKNRKDRMVPIGEQAIAWCEKYLFGSRPQLVVDQNEPTLFLTRHGKPFRPKRMSELVHKYVEDADLGKEGSCHMFRHTMATLMLENGADIRYIQAILGHGNLETTEIYTHVSIRKLQEVHAACHPAKMRREEPEAEALLSSLADEGEDDG